MLLRLFFCLLGVLFINAAFPQSRSSDTASVVTITQIPQDGFLLDKGWKYQGGDSSAWASSHLDDRSWQRLNPALPPNQLPQIPTEGIGWLRLHLQISPALRRRPLLLQIQQNCASAIYLNGRLINQTGRISNQSTRVEAYTRNGAAPILVDFDQSPHQVLAIRFAPWPPWRFFNQNVVPYLLFAQLIDLPQAIRLLDQGDQQTENGIAIGICLLLTLLHGAFFVYNPAQQANLYFAFYSLTLAACFILEYLFSSAHLDQSDLFYPVLICFNVLIQTTFVWPLRAIYALFARQPTRLYYGLWLLLPLIVAVLLLPLIPLATSTTWFPLLVSMGLMALAIMEMLRLIGQAIYQRKRGAYLLASGFVITLVLIAGHILLNCLGLLEVYISQEFVFVLMLSPALGISLYLAREFALDSQLLQVKLLQVQELSARSIAQEQEKQQLLAVQNETLERQVAERTTQLRQSLNDLKATQAQLIQKEKMASLGELTAGIAHEIQNPLNFVNNFSEVSADLVEELNEGHLQRLPQVEKTNVAELLEDLTSNLKKIQHHGQRASGIVRGMLEHASISSGEVRLTDLNALCEEYLKLAYLSQRAKDKDFTCTLETQYDLNLEKVEVMTQELSRVFLNLFTNAFYAVRQRQQRGEPDYRPMVRVRTHQSPSGLEIRVADNGIGISDTIKPKIFQPFFTTKPPGEGTGLGLSLSYDIITKGHRGTLTINNWNGQGAEFIIYLPGPFHKVD